MALEFRSNAIYITGEAGRFFTMRGIPNDTFRFIKTIVSFYFFLTFRFADYTYFRNITPMNFYYMMLLKMINPR